jgi:dipeptidyl-peptidase-4
LNSYPEEAENVQASEKDSLLAYTIDNNLFISISGKQIQVTDDTDPGIVNGQTVHRNEFGISGGIFWSPTGQDLAYYRKDETMVSEYPIVSIDERIAEVRPVRYPMAGMTSEQVRLMVYHLKDGSTTTVKTGETADQYLTSVTWGPEGKDIYIALLNRDQNHLVLNRYDAATGDLIKTLFEEKDPEYVEPLFPLHFVPSVPNLFVWFSERDGYQHLYLYNTEGQMIRQLTQGEWVVHELTGFDPNGTKAFFLATKNSPLNQDLFSVDLKNGRITPLSLKPGTHRPVMNPSGKYFLDNFSDTAVCREYRVVDEKGRVLQVLHSSKDPMDNFETGRLRIFTLQAEDGTDLYCSMILPSGFDPAKKYPVIDYVYGGPHAQLVTNTWNGGASLFMYYMAEQGYIIFTLDNRGSDNRGRDFEQAVFRHLGTLETQDQMTGINYLKTLPFVDPERIGVHGWSYGGFMTISMMLKQPDVFKAGVCGGPVCDWKYNEVMYGERYMDTPEANPDGYKEASLLEQAANLEGDLLIIHGTSDDVVVWQHSLQMMKRFIEEGKLVDYFVYPGHGHGVGGKDRVHLNRKIEKYFLDHL